jgi:hypothetical protein
MLSVLALPSCGFKRQLVSITVTPDGANITGTDVNVQFTAIGHYIHPPDSRDLTNSVVWASSSEQVIKIDSTGLGLSGSFCGTNIPITATAHSDPHDSNSGIVVGTATVSVAHPPVCP